MRPVFLPDREEHQSRKLHQSAIAFGGVLILLSTSELIQQRGLRWEGYGHLHFSGRWSGHIATFTLSSWIISTLIVAALMCGLWLLTWGLRGTWLKRRG
jgi:hypothetical protein